MTEIEIFTAYWMLDCHRMIPGEKIAYGFAELN